MQIGLDYKIAENTYLNVDVKKFIIDGHEDEQWNHKREFGRY